MPRKTDPKLERLLGNCVQARNPEACNDRLDHCQTLAVAGLVGELIAYANASGVAETQLEVLLKQAFYSARRLNLVKEIFVYAKHQNIVWEDGFVFEIRQGCILRGDLLGLKTLLDHGYNVSLESLQTALAYRHLKLEGLEVKGHLEIVRLQPRKYLIGWVDSITRANGWRSEEEKDFACSVLRKPAKKEQ